MARTSGSKLLESLNALNSIPAPIPIKPSIIKHKKRSDKLLFSANLTSSLTLLQERGLGQPRSWWADMSSSRSGRKRIKPTTSGWWPVDIAQLHQSSLPALRSKWRKRLARALDIVRATALSSARFPAATIYQPSGTLYSSPSRRSRMNS